MNSKAVFNPAEVVPVAQPGYYFMNLARLKYIRLSFAQWANRRQDFINRMEQELKRKMIYQEQGRRRLML